MRGDGQCTMCGMSTCVIEIGSVTVYCSSSNEVDASYLNLATELGGLFVEAGWKLVYGGGSVGLMGRIARATRYSFFPEAIVTWSLRSCSSNDWNRPGC